MSNPTDDDRSAGEPGPEQPTVAAPVGASTPETWTDPTAPVWSEQTSSLPTPRTDDAPQDAPVWAAPPPSAPPASAPDSAFATPPTSWDSPPANPYAYSAEQSTGSAAPPPFQQPATSTPAAEYQGQQSSMGQTYPAYSQPYGQQYGQQGQPGQPVPAYGQGAYGQGGSPYANPSPNNVSAIVLTIVAGLTMLSSCFVIGTPSLVLGIMALTAHASNPELSRKRARIGWIVYGVNWAVAVLLLVVGLIVLVAFSDTGAGNPNSF